MNEARSTTRELVCEGIEAGCHYHEIADGLHLARSTVAYHARALGYPADGRFGRRYDWTEIRAYYEAGHSLNECRRRFGFRYDGWARAVRRGDIQPRTRALPLGSLLVEDRPTQRGYLKRRILPAGLKENRREACGLVEWRGAELALAVHHVNGRKHDNRLENLQLLCPSCHSQTENFAGRNRGGGTTRRRSSIAGDVDRARHA